uniref:Uncharacterized protein n=1 Tax=Cacopsylla melanoneura TaxID=428564 RepID=A0A8D8XE42_9HEMI
MFMGQEKRGEICILSDEREIKVVGNFTSKTASEGIFVPRVGNFLPKIQECGIFCLEKFVLSALVVRVGGNKFHRAFRSLTVSVRDAVDSEGPGRKWPWV